jgi:hypothetical protein
MDPLACNNVNEGRKRTLLSKRMGREPRQALVEKMRTWPSTVLEEDRERTCSVREWARNLAPGTGKEEGRE